MEASSTASPLPRPLEVPAWKTIVSHAAAAFIAILFIGAGIWKATDPYGWAKKVEALLVPYQVSLPLAIALGFGEILAGVLILVPRFRRWGAIVSAVMLLGFMGYMGINYSELKGQDCTCFPPIHLPFGITLDFTRAVGPEFFIGDLAFLAVAAVAGLWAKPSRGLRNAAVIAGAIAVFAGVSFGVAYTSLNGVVPPDSITIEGQEVSLKEGRFFIFFYNPQCPHCNAAAKQMSQMKFNPEFTVVAVPNSLPEWAPAFIQENNFTIAKSSFDYEKLAAVFKHEYPPYGVVIERGRQTGVVANYDVEEGAEHREPAATLRKLGVIE